MTIFTTLCEIMGIYGGEIDRVKGWSHFSKEVLILIGIKGPCGGDVHT